MLFVRVAKLSTEVREGAVSSAGVGGGSRENPDELQNETCTIFKICLKCIILAEEPLKKLA